MKLNEQLAHDGKASMFEKKTSINTTKNAEVPYQELDRFYGS